MEDLYKLRGTILRVARTQGLGTADAEDVAQQTLEVVAKKQTEVDSVEAYAVTVAKRIASKVRRRNEAAARLPFAVNAADELAPAVDPEEILHLSAALEQFIVFGGEGRTRVLTPHLSSDAVDAAVLAELRYYHDVLCAAPVTERSKRRLRDKFATSIRGALQRSGVELRNVPVSRSAPDLSMKEEPDAHQDGRGSKLRILHPLVGRGVLLLRRLAPRLSSDQAIEIASDVFGHSGASDE